MKYTSRDLPETATACSDEQCKECDEKAPLFTIQGQSSTLESIKGSVDPKAKVDVLIERAWYVVRVHLCTPGEINQGTKMLTATVNSFGFL